MEIPLIIPTPENTTTPHRHPNFYYSAPTTPIHTNFQQQHDDDDFAFDFSGQLEPPSISDADDLFHCGQIKIINPLYNHHPESPESQAFKKKKFENFTETFHQTPGVQTQNPPKRGKKTTIDNTRTSRSSSPFRVSDILSEYDTNQKKEFENFTEVFRQTPVVQTQNSPRQGRKTATDNTRTRGKQSRSSSPFRVSDILSEDDTNQKNSLTWYNKWNLKNLLLFRSTSEGSARRRKLDPMNKYSRINNKDVKNSSFRSTDSVVVGSNGRRVVRKVSAHEIHYTANRAVAEEMRRRTYLPYKSGLLGCLGFHNNNNGIASVHEISRGG